jgi:hypothetical protein
VAVERAEGLTRRRRQAVPAQRLVGEGQDGVVSLRQCPHGLVGRAAATRELPLEGGITSDRRALPI